MKFLSWLSFEDEKSFAKNAVNQLAKELPPVLMEKRRKVLSVNKITRLLERTYVAASDYQLDHRLTFIGRAVLANNFRWELSSAGYPQDFVSVATEGLVIELSKAARKRRIAK